MKKKGLMIMLIILIVICFLIILLNKKEKFYLEDKFYGSNELITIDGKELENLINSKDSFGVFVYQTMCATSTDFSEILKEFQKDNLISFYMISFSDIKDVKQCNYLKYYPSFIIYKEGKMVDYLDANSNSDIKFYKNKDEFKKWITQYIEIKDE